MYDKTLRYGKHCHNYGLMTRIDVIVGAMKVREK